MYRYRPHLIALAVIVLLALLPTLLSTGAMSFAKMNGCRVHEGYENACMVYGVDFGGALYSLFVFGWFSLIALPVGAVLLLPWALWLMITIVRHQRQKSGRAGSDTQPAP